MIKRKAACLMLVNNREELILHKRSDSPHVHFAGYWGPIGGAAEGEESPRDCMLRECMEETIWKPHFLHELFLVQAHCDETVFFSRIHDESKLCCMEGEGLQAFSFEQLENVNVSPYHRQIIQKFIRHYQKNKSRFQPPQVLLYTKLLSSGFGGYVTAGSNLYRMLSSIWHTTVVTDETLPQLLQSSDRFDLLVFNATYENTTIFEQLARRCDRIWTVEHNAVCAANAREIRSRIASAEKVIVPSMFLRDQFLNSGIGIDDTALAVVPLPIDDQVFCKQVHKAETSIRFCSFCALKPVRRLEQSIRLIHQLRLRDYSCQYHIYGFVPYQGDESYAQRIQDLIEQLQLTDCVEICPSVTPPHRIAEIMGDYDFYLDSSRHESYGEAKLEAIFSRLGMVITGCENDRKLMPPGSEFFDGDIQAVTEKLCHRLEHFTKDFASECEMREKVRNYAVKRFNDETVSQIVEDLYYGSV